MTLPIIRIYDSAANASGAVQALKRGGFTDDMLSMQPLGERSSNDSPGGVQIGWRVSVTAPFGTGERATKILEELHPIASSLPASTDSGAESIAWLSRPASPGAISALSSSVSPGSISRLSRWTGHEGIAKWSDWSLSGLFGLPLLTRSQRPVEADSTLLVYR